MGFKRNEEKTPQVFLNASPPHSPCSSPLRADQPVDQPDWEIYVSGMADETFGISVLEAQASGLPVVGVASGAMIDRVPEGAGLLGPVNDAAAMAANVTALWRGDHAGARKRSLALADAHNRWDQTFEQLIRVEYSAALAARDARRARGWGLPARRALDVS